MDQADQQFIDLRTLSRRCGLSRRTIRSLIHDHNDPLPSYVVAEGGKFLFSWAETERWIRRHRVRPVDMTRVADDIINSIREQDHD